MTLTSRPRLLQACLLAAALAAASLSYCALLPPAGAREREATPGPAAAALSQEPACCGGQEGDDRPHLLAAAYYSFKGGFASELLLNNKGPRPLEVSPTLFSLEGERLDLDPVTVEAESFRMVDMRGWVAGAGPQFQEGSVQVFHRGRDLVLGAQVFVADEAQSLSFEEKLSEPATFKSSRLEGVWWLPHPKGEVLLAVSNTTDAPVSAAVTVAGEKPRQVGDAALELAPHETRVLDVGRDLMGREQGAVSQLGGISVNHSGPRGAVLARALAQDSEAGYSLAVQFSEPAAAKSSRLQGAGLRLGSAGGEPLTPVFVARNVGDAEATVSGRLPYTSADGGAASVPLPELRLAPGEAAVVEAARAVREAGLGPGATYAGVEFEHTGAPGAVLITALSVGRGGGQLFRVPLWDVHAQRSSTGGYPWFIEGDSSTTVYIKNTAAHPQQYFLQLTHPGGVYSVGVRTVEGGQTVTYDLRELRDTQAPDARGGVIPADAAGGQLHWSKVGMEEGVIIGRSEQADVALGVSSNYACLNCCNDNPINPDISPDSVTDDVGGTEVFEATYELQNCYGGVNQRVDAPNNTLWTSSDTDVATVVGGTVVARGPGTATITAKWTAERYVYVYDDPGGFGGFGHCEISPISTQFSVSATYTVRPSVEKIQYQSGDTFTDITGTLYVLKGTSVTFKAVPNPPGATWPTGRPVWGGTSGATGTGLTKTITFNTTSASTSDFKTVTAQSGNTAVVNVLVYELRGVFTPQNNFAGRSLDRFGLAERVNLTYSSSPGGVTAAQAGGLTWKIAAGSGQLAETRSDGANIYIAPSTPASVSLKLEVGAGPSKGLGATFVKSVIAPSGAYMRQAPGTSLVHVQGTCSVGFFGQAFLLPTDVSFSNIKFQEGQAVATATGFFASANGEVHPSGATIAVSGCNLTTGCKAFDDFVYTGEWPPPFSSGDFRWPIPWRYVVGVASPVTFYTAIHHQTADSTGRATIEKAGAGPFAKNAGDPSS